ncbi:65-kDa microtubule-associated protein 3-like [Mangifera indica]|uniref:65-kDa microtubule-associated protein 3-like n=1 Tax=Mangifera indica TaxID=29780 RepID=UPI001CFB1777|nr:65-kDa microtubule-associated protein 3-like [Mangifera indica]XP_044467548.1 65-kDa microtubule-associated protein 3-like [Mangifera indica]
MSSNDPLLQVETTCGTLLYELQIIWDEVGETDTDRDKMLLELEQECLQVYRRKVDQANQSRAQLRQTIADSEAELAAICSALGERPVHIRQSDQSVRSLKEELRRILPQMEEMRKRKTDRRNQFVDVLEQIRMIKNEIHESAVYTSSNTVVDEADLSLRKLEEFHRELLGLQKEKSDRVKKVQELLNILNSLCLVLGMDFKPTVSEVHPSLGDSEGTRSISNDTIERLTIAIDKLREVKIQRMQKLQDLATTMLELWNLMDTPIEEQQMFQNVTCNIAASEHEITEPNTLSVDFLNCVEAEVSRLEELKLSKMKELVLKKRSELEEICRKTHMVPEYDSSMEDAIEAIESEALDPASILEQIELQIATVKEEAFSRKEILEKIEKWLAACEEESWLEEYNRDENRYNAGKGAHLTLKRAEKARSLVNKLPGMVEALTSKTLAWEKDRGVQFLYDGVHLLSMLEEYTILRQEKEQERRWQRDQKKLQGQLIAEQEALYGSKPSPSKVQSVKKTPRVSTGSASSRRLSSIGGTMLQTPKPDSISSIKATPNSRPIRKIDRMLQNDNSNAQQDDGFSSASAARKGLDMVGVPIKQQSLGSDTCEPESPLIRKPFSPISSTTSSKSNMTNLLDDFSTNCETTLPKIIPPNDLSYTTPLKTTSIVDEENRTPQAMPIPLLPTPSTVSMPMQTAMTPAPAPTAPIPFSDASSVDEIPEEIEYSFEERRAGFVLPKSQSMIPV